MTKITAKSDGTKTVHGKNGIVGNLPSDKVRSGPTSISGAPTVLGTEISESPNPSLEAMVSKFAAGRSVITGEEFVELNKAYRRAGIATELSERSLRIERGEFANKLYMALASPDSEDQNAFNAKIPYACLYDFIGADPTVRGTTPREAHSAELIDSLRNPSEERFWERATGHNAAHQGPIRPYLDRVVDTLSANPNLQERYNSIAELVRQDNEATEAFNKVKKMVDLEIEDRDFDDYQFTQEFGDNRKYIGESFIQGRAKGYTHMFVTMNATDGYAPHAHFISGDKNNPDETQRRLQRGNEHVRLLRLNQSISRQLNEFVLPQRDA